jgi:sucrose phosphorylase
MSSFNFDKGHIIYQRIEQLYPERLVEETVKGISQVIEKYSTRITSKEYHLSQKDIVLIAYGDQVHQDTEASLKTLKLFLDNHLKNFVNSVHILPFYPYSSDDGFSVVNYNEVDPHMGSWREIESISGEYRLMVDGVINHISQFSNWFKAYLNGDEYYKDFFLDIDPSIDLSRVVRPRTSPLLTEFVDNNGKIHNIWTTFSADQVDLNYKSQKVLIAVLDALFYYIEKGAKLIRLDAIAFIWKEIGSECVHLPQTHELIQLMREVLHEVAPEVIIITETNVPHDENVSYFGSGDDEAQMVYNFALPPLILHSILAQDTTKLTTWAQSLSLPSDKVCFFNFTASHDGIGLRAVRDILDIKEVEYLVDQIQNHNGLVSYRTEENGSKSPYELNCSYIDALSHPEESNSIKVKKMLLSQATALVMPGVPGIYFHSLVGSQNYHDGVKHSGMNRTINREKFHINWLENELSKQGSLSKTIFDSYKRLISIRINERAFNPFGKFRFLNFGEKLFAVKQNCVQSKEYILAIHNFSNKIEHCELPDDIILPVEDIITNKTIEEKQFTLDPYQIMWLKGDLI